MWEDEAGSPDTLWVANASRVQICADSIGGRLAVSNSANDQVAQSMSPGHTGGSWYSQTPSTSGVLWTACCAGPSLFAIGSSTGDIDTRPTGEIWTARTSGISDYINCIEHNHESGGDARFVCLSNSNVTHSPDGATWTASAHGLSSAPMRLAYSAAGQRWIALLANGDIAYSDDQGVSWTQVSGPLPTFSTPWPSGNGYGLASNGEGGWIAINAKTTEHSLWASSDNGDTWRKVYPTKADSTIAAGVAYGNGAFALVGEDGALFTPRTLGT